MWVRLWNVFSWKSKEGSVLLKKSQLSCLWVLYQSLFLLAEAGMLNPIWRRPQIEFWFVVFGFFWEGASYGISSKPEALSTGGRKSEKCFSWPCCRLWGWAGDCLFTVVPPPRQAAGDAEPGTFPDGSTFAALLLWEEARKPVLDFWP